MARETTPDVTAAALTRRRFLGAVGSGTALVLSGCRAAPPEEIVPYVTRPPEVTPGKSRMYATAFSRSGYAVGLLGESREGRPLKIEGHPLHPASLGGSGVWEQASVLSLYDDERAGRILRRNDVQSWTEVARRFGPRSEAHRFARRHGEGLHLFMEPTSSIVVDRLLSRFGELYPRARVWFDPSNAPVERWEGARLAFGEVRETLYDFERADRVLALDADFLTGMPMSLRWARHFAKRRHLEEPSGSLNRMYAVEPSPTCTGITADHRLAARPSEIERIAVGLVLALGEHTELPASLRSAARPYRDEIPHHEWLRTVARDLWEHRERAVIAVGDRQPAWIHAIVHGLHEVLGTTVVRHVRSPILGAGTDAFEPSRLLDALDADAVEVLATLEGNPAFTAPAQYRFGERARNADVHLHAAPYFDETAADAEWFVATRHYLEAWDALRAQDGTLTPVQPLVRPLFGGRQVTQILSLLLGEPNRSPRELAREAWEAESDTTFERALAAGLAPSSGHGRGAARASFEAIGAAVPPPGQQDDDQGAFELVVQPDPRILDGRFANNAWLQELPEPITKLVWDNAALMSPASARDMNVWHGDLVDVKVGTTRVRLPVWPLAGMPERVVVAWLGYGRTAGGRIGRAVGVDVGVLRPHGSWFAPSARVDKTGERFDLVSTQDHQEMEGRPIVLRRTLEEFHEEPAFAEPHDETPESIYPDRIPEDVVQWGMSIDLNKCTGCSACVIACQAENNIPAVGKVNVAMGREMHWMRIDRYFTGEPGSETVDVQPMLCQHCEQAPCEYVCPVNATVHSPDGLNEMIYNRCVGTRFCSNNCPYKVRRFNWFDYVRDIPETRKMQMNPDVTVRARGVMEKCTYCVQRIRRAEIDAQLEGRRIRDEEVVTACQQACPTEAIVFGQVSDPHSQVSHHFENPRCYAVLNDLGTRPRTRYLAKVTNPNPELEEGR